MYNKKWCRLRKINGHFELEPEAAKTRCLPRRNFSQVAFDKNEERLVAVDSAGSIFEVDLSDGCPTYRKLGTVGQATFVAFNPIDDSEILIGLTTAAIKILKIERSFAQYCVLTAHKVPPTQISFYKEYCLTCSRKEVIIWYLRSCSKAHQLRIDTKNVVVKKGSFSSLGHVVVLYHNDTIQAWVFKQLENDAKIDAKAFGIRNIKDFAFTRNGRALILASAQNKVVVLSTCDWSQLKNLSLPDNFAGIKQLSVVPSPLDGGANKIVAIVSSNCTLHLFDLNLSCFIDTLQPVNLVKKIAVSPNGRYIAYIKAEGVLRLIPAEKLFSEKCEQEQKVKELCRPSAHRVNDHLRCVRECVKQELRLERLIPILKQFGEYPEKYRVIIWSTILKLPANKNAYNALANKAACSKFTFDLLKNYPLASRSKRTLLITTMNCLVQWCPLLVQCTFLPNLIFPFLMVCQRDLLLAFELILIVLLNYCQKWFEYHPLPPLNVLGIMENILMEADPSLLNIFCEHGITSSDYAWPLLRTAMSEVLSGSEWLILWDHLLSFQRPSLLIMCVVAYSIYSRGVIISLLHSPESIKKFYCTQGHVRAKDLLKIAEQLDNETPHRVHPSRYLRNNLILLPSKGTYPPFILQEYPKFLAEDNSISQLERLKEKEKIMRESSRKAAKSAEQKRLQRETEEFVKKIEEARLNEVQKCMKELSYDINQQLEKAVFDTRRESLEEENIYEEVYGVPPLDIGDEYEDESIDSEYKRHKDYGQLQEDVDKLEYEVQSFLETLSSRRSGEYIN